MISETSLTPGLAERLRVRTRPDLVVREQLYEGRTHYVVKDPIGLRYFRFKEEEYFLLQQLDGKRSLEDVKDDYERQFRPHKITIEELARFASQLTQAGIAQVDSPRQGQVLYERFRKMRFRQRLAAWSNVLYIKIPVFDPDWLLERMRPWLGWIYHPVTVLATVVFWAIALLWVAAHFDEVQSKLPEFYTFFNWHNVFFMWLALGVVKIIHEFGHGLTCKYFEGECHEMGVLFLVLSPCLYCDVSDSWLLPNKWHRVYIGAAGIYVELSIAAMCVFIWWNTDPGLINNLALSTMFVCSVNTVMFNGNPLLRYDGYYILMDMMEIPNLRAKAARFFSSLFGKVCLGLPTDIESYLPRSRRAFFFFFAVASYLYRWFISFAILWFLYRFLAPYKLQTVSTLLAAASLSTLLVLPSYQLGKYLWESRRTANVSKLRLSITAVVFAVAGGLFFFVPVPWDVKASFILSPERPAYVWAEVPGALVAQHAKDGDSVKKGDVLAELRNLQKEEEIQNLRRQADQHRTLAGVYGIDRRGEMQRELDLATKRDEQTKKLEMELSKLVLRAPRSGIVMQPPKPQELGTYFELGSGRPFCRIGDTKKLQALVMIDQSDKDLISENQDVVLRLYSHALKSFEGKLHIPMVQADQLPPELASTRGGEEQTIQDKETGEERPVHTLYHGLVAVDNSDGILESGMRGRARIEAARIPLATHVWRWLLRTFHFEA